MSRRVFRVEIHTDGAAFGDEGWELADILASLVGRLRDGTSDSHGPLRDGNGNLCGQWTIGVED